jgi:hypothetical protein
MKTIFLLLLCSTAFAQKRDQFWLKQAASVTTAFTGGFFFRRAEIRKDDFRRYAAVHPNADPQWANAKLSFRNKYKNWPHDKSPAYFGSTSFLVFTTDGFHADNAIAGAAMAANIGFSMSLYEKPNLKRILLQVGVSWVAYASGRWAADKVYGEVR